MKKLISAIGLVLLAVSAMAQPLIIPVKTTSLTRQMLTNNSAQAIIQLLFGSTNIQGIASLNGLTQPVQTFNAGSAGSDFNITSDGISQNIFNIPTASSTTRGALSAADWIRFNAATGGTTNLAGPTSTGLLRSNDWVTFNAGSGVGKLAAINNLSDVSSAPTSLANLGGINALTGTNIAAAQALAATNSLITNASPTAVALGAYPDTFIPSMDPRVKFWFAASAFAGNPDSYQNSTVPDLSGNGNALTNTVASKQLIYHPFRLNGGPALSVTNNQVFMATPPFLSSSYDKGFTFFAVVQRTDGGTGLAAFAVHNSGQFLASRLGDAYNYTGNSVNSKCRSLDISKPAIECFRYDGTNMTIRINGVATVVTPSSISLGLNGVLTVGDVNGFSMVGDYGEMIVCQGALSDNDCRRFENYIAKHNGFNRGHFIFDGASNTLGFGNAYVSGSSYPGQVATNFNGTMFGENMGIGGQTALAISTNTPVKAFQSVFTGRDIYVEWAGDNDLAAGVSSNTVYAAIVTNMMNARLAGLRTVVTTLIQRQDVAITNQALYENARLSINTLIRSNYQFFADAISDPGADPRLNPTDPTYYQADLAHLTPAGYFIIASNAYRAILSITVPGANGYPQGNAASLTNVNGLSLNYGTNAQTTVVNMAQRFSDVTTNATFAWVGLTGLSTTNYQFATLFLTNTSGGVINFTAPVNTHTNGTFNCTNAGVTMVEFRVSANRWTNAVATPLF